MVLCFHGLPLPFRTKARVVVFQQNKHHLSLTSLSEFPPRTALRLLIERCINQAFRKQVSEYVVQTPSMRRALLRWHRGEKPPKVTVFPFVDSSLLSGMSTRKSPEKWDFIYVADGEAHKNHWVLLAAWRQLASDGLFPSLALTLAPKYEQLINYINGPARLDQLRVTNLGELPRHSTFDLYRAARALIFPSTAESFGLPLIEATALGVPIIAAELDYVRDVCTPAETFDPKSEVSIARAVRRFLGAPEDKRVLRSASDFLAGICSTE